MDDRTTVATAMLAALLSKAHPHMNDPHNRPSMDGEQYGKTTARNAAAWADALLRELRPLERPPPTPMPQEEGDPYEREKAAAAAIEDDRPF